MATKPPVKTQSVGRSKLASVFKDHETLKAFENLTSDVSTVLPDAVMVNEEAIEAAQATANQAKAEAEAAQTAAVAAQASADALKALPYLTVTPSADAPNSRVLAVDPLAFKAVDGGAGAALTLLSADLLTVLPADVADATGVLVDATGLVLDLVEASTYIVEAALTFQSAALTTGIALAFTLPAGATISGGFSHNKTATTTEGSYNIADGAVKGATTGVMVINENVPITGRWVIKTDADAGPAQLQFKTGVAASAVTLKAGLSLLTARRIA